MLYFASRQEQRISVNPEVPRPDLLHIPGTLPSKVNTKKQSVLEYKCVSRNLQNEPDADAFNALGGDGWELASIFTSGRLFTSFSSACRRDSR